MTKGSWKPQMKSGVARDECVSALQKMLRSSKEHEALVIAQELFDNGS